jgi:hypothetical protein
MSSLMSLRLLRRRMRDRPRHFVYFKFVFSPSCHFGCLLSAIVQHVRRIRVVNAILFCSFTGSRSRRVSPTFLRRPDVHLSLMSGWVHLGLNSCQIQTVCLHLIGSVLMSSPIVLSLLLASCGEPSIMRYSILVPRFQFLVFRFCGPRFSFLVSRSFLVFSYSFSVTCLPVSRSSFVVLSSITFFSSFSLSSVGSFFSLSSSVHPFLDVLTFTSC